jgi:hypothetical protein
MRLRRKDPFDVLGAIGVGDGPSTYSGERVTARTSSLEAQRKASPVPFPFISVRVELVETIFSRR